MKNPLDNVPLNTKQVYVSCQSIDGCQIYMPVDSYDDIVINNKLEQLKEYFAYQYTSDNGIT